VIDSERPENQLFVLDREKEICSVVMKPGESRTCDPLRLGAH